jgi:hypothetical protein
METIMETRICKYCNEEHPIDFYEKANVIKGVEYRRWKCRNCYREMKKNRIREIKKWLKDLKKTLKCKKCIAKCDVYCSNHHRELHWNEKNGV